MEGVNKDKIMTSRRTGGYVLCMGCYSLFYVPKKKLNSAKFCSKLCKYTGEVKECENCGKEFYVQASRVDFARFCSSSCWTQSEESKNIVKSSMAEIVKTRNYLKENNPNWRGGITEEHKKRLLTAEWRKIRAEAIKYYGGRCFECGSEEKLHVHHRIPVRLGGTDDMENLSLFCQSCHAKYEHYFIILNAISEFCANCKDSCDEICPLYAVRTSKNFEYGDI